MNGILHGNLRADRSNSGVDVSCLLMPSVSQCVACAYVRTGALVDCIGTAKGKRESSGKGGDLCRYGTMGPLLQCL